VLRFIKICLIFIVLLAFVACAQLPISMPTLDPRFSNFHIVYLVDESTSGIPSPEYVSQALGAKTVFSWPEVMTEANESRLSALIIHRDAIEEVISDDLAYLYDQGIALVFFDVWSPEVGDLIQNRTIANDGWMNGTAEPMAGDFYIIVFHKITCENGQVAQGRPWRCPGNSVVNSYSASRTAESLVTEEDFAMFQNVLLVQLQNP
jgi:hypothetical protein